MHTPAICTSSARLLLFLGWTILPLSLLAADLESPSSDPGDDGLDQWAILAAETDDLLEWSEDPLSDIDLGPVSTTIWSISTHAGRGYSSNVLKRLNATSSDYWKLEGDAFFNTLFTRSNLTAILFFEYTDYALKTEAATETLLFFNGTWSVEGDSWIYGTQLTAFYGDQIYDASLSQISSPEGKSLRQFRPEVALFIERGLGKRHLLRMQISIKRATFGDSEDDYWRGEASANLTRAWTSELTSETGISIFRESYDEEPSREANGLVRDPLRRLEIGGVRFEQAFSWRPSTWPDLKAVGRFGISAEEEVEGLYESNLRLTGSLSLAWQPEWIDLRIFGRWQNVRYRDRFTDNSDRRPLRQDYRAFGIEVERELIWNTSLKVGVEWNDLASRLPEEVFSEHRLNILLGWRY